jgi:chromosome segregation ATPase
MLAIFEKIRRPATDAADLRQRLAEVSETLPQLEAEVRRHQQRRAEGLLALSDRDVERIEAELALALRNRDRANAAMEELERRVADAEAAEAGAMLDAERAAVEAKAAAVAARLRKEYGDAGAVIVRLMDDLSEAEEAVRTLNRKLADAGRHSDAVPAVETRTLDFGVNSETIASVLVLTSLRPLGSMPGYGSGRRVAENFGLKP